MKKREFIKLLENAKRHHNPEVTFWIDEDVYLEIESMGEFGITPEVTISFKVGGRLWPKKSRKTIVKQLKSQKAKTQKLRASLDRRRVYQLKMKSEGRCYICGKPACKKGASRCEFHRDYQRKYSAERRKKLKAIHEMASKVV